MFSADAMNKFCKSSLCVEKVRESYVLIGRRVVAVPGVADAFRLAFPLPVSVELRQCCRFSTLRVPALEDGTANKSLIQMLHAVPGTC